MKEITTDELVVDATFREIDEKFAVLNDPAKYWIKMKIMTHITEAYKRGKLESNEQAVRVALEMAAEKAKLSSSSKIMMCDIDKDSITSLHLEIIRKLNTTTK